MQMTLYILQELNLLSDSIRSKRHVLFRTKNVIPNLFRDLFTMKRLFLVIILLIGSALCFAQQSESYTSDVQLYNEVRQTFSNGFYPGTVTAADLLWEKFPESSFVHQSLSYKGEALINMESYDEAVRTLESAVTYMHSGSPEIVRSTYLLGRAYYHQKKYTTALEKLHLACNLCLTNNEMEYYPQAVLYSAYIFYELEEYKNAIPLFEYVITNGKKYEAAAYGEAIQKLFVCYNSTGAWKKTEALYKKFNASSDDMGGEGAFEKNIWNTLTLYYADACAGDGKYKEAYDSYCRVIENGDEALAVNALKKAYIISCEHDVGKDSGEVLAKSEDVFKGNPAFVNEFWLRLGIDEYRAHNYAKAEEYFLRIDNDSTSEIFSADIEVVRAVYEAKSILEEGRPVHAAEDKLNLAEQYLKKSKIEKINDAFYSTLLQCKLQGEKWEEVPVVFAKIKQPGASDKFAVSSYYYKKGQFEKVDSGCGELYASSLCKLGLYDKACVEYEKLNSVSADYAKALFCCGRYADALKIAQACDAVEKDYLCGLCLINQRSWKKASESFASYIRQNSGKENFIKLSLYYKGYAEYNLEEFKNAYSSFVRYTVESQNDLNAYSLKSYEYAVKAALQTGDFKNASAQAGNLLKFSESEESRRRAVVLSAEIFADYEKYDEAISLLAPYANGQAGGNSAASADFSAQALFLMARMYERKGDVLRADENYRRVYESMPRSAYAEEAMYRVGEVFYSAEKYSEAFTRFNAYVYKYTSGEFSDAALFYCGDCALRLGQESRSIMMNRTLLQKYPSSVYAYGASKNLLSAYYNQENYSEALGIARTMLKDFPQQSADDEIGKRLTELEKIVGGTDRRVAEKQTEYSKLGGADTKAGRAAGSQLVRLYAESLYTQSDAYELASQLLPKQTGADEREDAAYNAEFIADYCRKNQDNKKAAEMYLRAAEYYRNVRSGERAAAALYGAAEAFAASGLSGDARETAELLKQLYPDSVQAQNVDRVTGASRY